MSEKRRIVSLVMEQRGMTLEYLAVDQHGDAWVCVDRLGRYMEWKKLDLPALPDGEPCNTPGTPIGSGACG